MARVTSGAISTLPTSDPASVTAQLTGSTLNIRVFQFCQLCVKTDVTGLQNLILMGAGVTMAQVQDACFSMLRVRFVVLIVASQCALQDTMIWYLPEDVRIGFFAMDKPDIPQDLQNLDPDDKNWLVNTFAPAYLASGIAQNEEANNVPENQRMFNNNLSRKLNWFFHGESHFCRTAISAGLAVAGSGNGTATLANSKQYNNITAKASHHAYLKLVPDLK